MNVRNEIYSKNEKTVNNSLNSSNSRIKTQTSLTADGKGSDARREHGIKRPSGNERAVDSGGAATRVTSKAVLKSTEKPAAKPVAKPDTKPDTEQKSSENKHDTSSTDSSIGSNSPGGTIAARLKQKALERLENQDKNKTQDTGIQTVKSVSSITARTFSSVTRVKKVNSIRSANKHLSSNNLRNAKNQPDNKNSKGAAERGPGINSFQGQINRKAVIRTRSRVKDVKISNGGSLSIRTAAGAGNVRNLRINRAVESRPPLRISKIKTARQTSSINAAKGRLTTANMLSAVAVKEVRVQSSKYIKENTENDTGISSSYEGYKAAEYTKRASSLTGRAIKKVFRTTKNSQAENTESRYPKSDVDAKDTIQNSDKLERSLDSNKNLLINKNNVNATNTDSLNTVSADSKRLTAEKLNKTAEKKGRIKYESKYEPKPVSINHKHSSKIIYDTKTYGRKSTYNNIHHRYKSGFARAVRHDSAERNAYSAPRIKTNLNKKKVKAAKIRTTAKKQRKAAAELLDKSLKLAQKAAQALMKAALSINLGVILAVVASFVVIAGLFNIISSMPAFTVMADESVVQAYRDKMTNLQQGILSQIDEYKNSSSYRNCYVTFHNEDNVFTSNFKELMCAYAVLYEQEIENETEYLLRFEKMFNQANYIETRVKTRTYTSSGGKRRRYKDIYVDVYILSSEQIYGILDFDDEQIEWHKTLMENFEDTFSNIDCAYTPLGGGINGGFSGAGGLSKEEIEEIMKKAPNTTATREKIVSTALSLVGKVKYFWGGKSPAGINPKWGTMQLVTAGGDRTSGTYQPYGLDCSGFTDWVYKTAGVGNVLSAGGTAYQWGQSFAIKESELLPGDLVFLQPPNSSGVNHVGIYVGEDDSGNNLYVHCQGGTGVVINSYSGFKYFRRVPINFGDDN